VAKARYIEVLSAWDTVCSEPPINPHLETQEPASPREFGLGDEAASAAQDVAENVRQGVP
jgi:hypothetical protein